MVGLNNSILVRAEFVELLLKELLFLICGGFLIQDKNVADIIVVYLEVSS